MPFSRSDISSSLSSSSDSRITVSSQDYDSYMNNHNLDQDDIFSSQDDLLSYDENNIENDLYFLSHIGTRSYTDYYDMISPVGAFFGTLLYFDMIFPVCVLSGILLKKCHIKLFKAFMELFQNT